MTLPTFEKVLAAYKASARRKPNARHDTRRIPGAGGQTRAGATEALLGAAVYARPHPLLCREMPCRWHHVYKLGRSICLRCGVTTDDA